MTSVPPLPVPLDLRRIAAITLDLDDTLWPIWPTIERAERVLHQWLLREAPNTADLLLTPSVLRELREATAKERSDLAHDLSALRRESIRTALQRAGENPQLAEPAFEVFFAERQRVTLYDDALPALKWLSERYPLVAISNGNADVERAGVGRWFQAAFSASRFGSRLRRMRFSALRYWTCATSSWSADIARSFRIGGNSIQRMARPRRFVAARPGKELTWL